MPDPNRSFQRYLLRYQGTCPVSAIYPRLREVIAIATLATLLGSSAVLAQAGETWTDPPASPEAGLERVAPDAGWPQLRETRPGSSLRSANAEAPDLADGLGPNRASSPSLDQTAERRLPQPRSAAETASEDDSGRSSARGKGTPAPARARQLAIAYLQLWSARNRETLAVTPEFYGAAVQFHGRKMSGRALFEEKRRFVRRWPERHYAPRRETMRADCEPAAQICRVHTVFAFTAVSAERGQRSTGLGTLELGISFAGQRPVIVFENSRVIQRRTG